MEDDQPSSAALDFQIAESRRVIDQQIEKVREIDQKAVRTVHIGVIFLGIILSALRISGSETAFNVLTIAGGLTVAASIVVGLFASTMTDPYFGPGSPLVGKFLGTLPEEDEWKITTLRGYQYWLQYNRTVNVDDAKWLLRAQILLAVGVLTTMVGFTLAM